MESLLQTHGHFPVVKYIGPFSTTVNDTMVSRIWLFRHSDNILEIKELHYCTQSAHEIFSVQVRTSVMLFLVWIHGVRLSTFSARLNLTRLPVESGQCVAENLFWKINETLVKNDNIIHKYINHIKNGER